MNATVLEVEVIMASKSIESAEAGDMRILCCIELILILFFISHISVVLVSLLFVAAVSGLSIPSVDEVIPVSKNVTTPASITNETNIALQPSGISNETISDIQNLRVPCRPNGNEPEFIPNLLECERYHLCINGQSYDHSCADGLIFSIDRMKCANTGRCLLDYLPVCQASGTFLPHVYECRHYFYCEPNEVDPILLACRPGQLFDQNTLRCVPEIDAVCGNPPPGDDLENWPGTK